MTGKSFEEMLNQGPEGDRRDYAAGAGSSEGSKADKKSDRTSRLIAVQRQANRRYGVPPESQGDAIEKRNAQ